MALEQDIAKLIEASNDLTTIVDNKIQDIDSKVQAKRNEVDNLISTTNTKVDNKLSSLSIIGDGGHGTRAINVAHLFTPEQGATFVHIKLPLKADTNHEMFHLKVSGYAYGEAKLVDATLVGYCYKPRDNVININTAGSHSPHLYKGADGYIYGRLTFTSQYYLTLSIDTMRVGNGRLFKHGDIELIRSDAETL
ncbi:hypothetical protein [Pseudoalteromonas aurantia]|uniref:Uncharacterized protein n=1 Tax=Pseudoalteromonas aurantia TaxID=43654 RepID=A0A5S3V852_9GAMM|nr:hypothetical protein [Pseudoalteromonas aurantia]TMO67473.1 hypothetical protein CWC19_13725 [Pseudoalteromonas aurantia]TMO71225.1 hypothetical protein CWC20_18190 [Pseudoalteromonas aurantia]